MKKELKQLKAHKQAKKQAKKERRAAKKVAKKERKRANKEGKEAIRETRRGHGSRECHHLGLSRPSHHSEGIVTRVARRADSLSDENPQQDMPGANVPSYTLDSMTISREPDDLREQARELEHEALVKETVAGGIRAAATSVDVPEKERVRRLEEANVVYEEAEAIRREIERLRAEASHLDREFAGSTASYGKRRAHSMGQSATGVGSPCL